MRPVALAGNMGSGKTTVAQALQNSYGCTSRSFGDVVRVEATKRGLDPADRAILQDLGHELLATIGAAGMVDRVLFPPCSDLVIDGVRHLDVLTQLQARLPDLVLVFLAAGAGSLDHRWLERGEALARQVAAHHAVEAEVADLAARATLLIRTEHLQPGQVAAVIAAAAGSDG